MLQMATYIFLIFSFLLCVPSYAQAENLQLDFNCDQNAFATERDVLRRKYEAEYDDLDEMVREYEAAGEQAFFKDRDFCIAKTDLNQDGVEDIFLYSGPGGFSCGTAGCETKAYLIDADGKWDEILALHAYAEGIWLTDIINGYRTLKIRQKKTCPCDTVIHADGKKALLNTKNVIYVFDRRARTYRAVGSDE